MQAAVRIVAVREYLELGMHHEQVAGVAVQLDFGKERHSESGGKSIREIRSVEPLCYQTLPRAVFEYRFKQAQAASFETRDTGSLYCGNHSGDFTG